MITTMPLLFLFPRLNVEVTPYLLTSSQTLSYHTQTRRGPIEGRVCEGGFQRQGLGHGQNLKVGEGKETAAAGTSKLRSLSGKGFNQGDLIKEARLNDS